MAEKLIRNEGRAKIIYNGGEIAPLQYKAIDAKEAERLMKLFPFLVEVPTLEDVKKKEADIPSRRGRKKAYKDASELLK